MTEGERIIKLETQMDNIEKKVDDGFKSVNEKLDAFIEKSEKTFAAKWVEKALWGVCTIVGGAVILAVIKNIHL